uniref:Uncharacterized protein n=1 Tax=Anguilla anguilla TaxID=7936 RepID=A0A0E9SU66_ANGAN
MAHRWSHVGSPVSNGFCSQNTAPAMETDVLFYRGPTIQREREGDRQCKRESTGRETVCRERREERRRR